MKRILPTIAIHKIPNKSSATTAPHPSPPTSPIVFASTHSRCSSVYSSSSDYTDSSLLLPPNATEYVGGMERSRISSPDPSTRGVFVRSRPSSPDPSLTDRWNSFGIEHENEVGDIPDTDTTSIAETQTPDMYLDLNRSATAARSVAWASEVDLLGRRTREWDSRSSRTICISSTPYIARDVVVEAGIVEGKNEKRRYTFSKFAGLRFRVGSFLKRKDSSILHRAEVSPQLGPLTEVIEEAKFKETVVEKKDAEETPRKSTSGSIFRRGRTNRANSTASQQTLTISPPYALGYKAPTAPRATTKQERSHLRRSRSFSGFHTAEMIGRMVDADQESMDDVMAEAVCVSVKLHAKLAELNSSA
ncbi:hypothetical protein BDQ17DRAFT_1430621 [Cyathus striatus]|nr:hypothetical protein BDQ17DRAFT_1430621 [Cyathus striatus]